MEPVMTATPLPAAESLMVLDVPLSLIQVLADPTETVLPAPPMLSVAWPEPALKVLPPAVAVRVYAAVLPLIVLPMPYTVMVLVVESALIVVLLAYKPILASEAGTTLKSSGLPPSVAVIVGVLATVWAGVVESSGSMT